MYCAHPAIPVGISANILLGNCEPNKQWHNNLIFLAMFSQFTTGPTHTEPYHCSSHSFHCGYTVTVISYINSQLLVAHIQLHNRYFDKIWHQQVRFSYKISSFRSLHSLFKTCDHCTGMEQPQLCVTACLSIKQYLLLLLLSIFLPKYNKHYFITTSSYIQK